MLDLLRNYRETLQHEHGWEVDLPCDECGAVVLPVCDGWRPSTSVRLGDKPTVFANLSCPRCSASMRDAAEKKLVELFRDVAIPESNRRLLRGYVLYAVASVLLLAAVLVVPWLMG